MLFVCEHTHIPASRKSPFPGGGELPKRYSHTHDPFVALAFAAAATKRLRLGTGICLVPQRDPIVTAKSVASLDRLSGGRFVFGIGGGWNVEEMENHGARYATRFKLMRERVLAMKRAVDRGGGAASTASSSSSTASGCTPSRCSSRIRRSCWAARPTTRCGAWSSSATAGSPAPAAASTRRRPSRGCAPRRKPAGRDPGLAHHQRVRRAARCRGAGGLPRGRHQPRAAGSARPRPRRDPAPARQDRAAGRAA